MGGCVSNLQTQPTVSLQVVEEDLNLMKELGVYDDHLASILIATEKLRLCQTVLAID